MIKRAVDFTTALIALLLLSPVLLILSLLIVLEDRRSPFYVGRRVSKGFGSFGMVKFRSMVSDAEKTGVMSTAGDDARITRMGSFLRRYKLDELPQLLNIVRGDMSFVGPRPNVPTEVALYSKEERRLLSVRPGVTDLASIVFSDEGDILEGSSDPDRDYNLLIRPWKNRLGLHLVDHQSLRLYLKLIMLTVIAILSKERALRRVEKILLRTGADPELIRICRRSEPLKPALPPGVTEETWGKHLTYDNE